MKNHWMENLKLEIKEIPPFTATGTWVPCNIEISKGLNSIKISCTVGPDKLNEKDCLSFAKFITEEIERGQSPLTVEERHRIFKFAEALSQKASIDDFLD